MGPYKAHLRYYPGDPLEEIRQEALDGIGGEYGVRASFERIEKRVHSDGMLREETLDERLEEMTQDVITVESEDEAGFRGAVREVYRKYRSPRTPYSFWGSTPEGERIAREVAEETGGGW